MDATSNDSRIARKAEYEFLDLTDIDEEERSSLTSALFAPAPVPTPLATDDRSGDGTDPRVAWTDPNYVVDDAVNMTAAYAARSHTIDQSSCSSGTPGPPTASSSLDSLTTTEREREMAPHSPQRNAPPARTGVPRGAAAPPPPQQLAYGQPPPPPPVYNPAPPPNHHWPHHVLPPSVYVSQVTANVNVHGYMGQYYPQPQYVTHPQTEPRGRDGRDRGKGRRGGGVKRAPSPPHPYLYYPQYYPSPQTAQGAPLYHVPVYPPVGYVTGYPCVPYLDYGMVEDPNQTEKGPEDYPPDALMEQEHPPPEMYYSAHPACLQPNAVYDPNRPLEAGCAVDGYPTFFAMPPPPAQQVHQFNVHAKNFVRQGEHKNYNQQPDPKTQEGNSNPVKGNRSVASPSVDSLPMKDLKVSNERTPPRQNQERAVARNDSSPPIENPPSANGDGVAPKPPTETPKGARSSDGKIGDPPNGPTPASVPAVAAPTANATASVPVPVPAPAPAKSAIPTNTIVVPNKVNKTNLAPFANNKTFSKTVPAQQLAGVIISQQGLPSKAPFSNKNKKDTPAKDAVDQNEISPTSAIAEPKRTVAIPAHNPPSVSIATKSPFGHARKPSVSSNETPTAPAAPRAPTASDFPPPPAPRRSVDRSSNGRPAPRPPPVVPAPAGNRTWASLFNANSTTAQTDESGNSSRTTTDSSTASSAQKPVAKVGPFDASPSQEIASDKSVSSEKPTSASVAHKGKKDASPHGENARTATPAQINDPLAYARGEFLSVYQLNHHTVSLQPRGLCNRSNYCYINAILQALIACPPFYNMLKSLPSTYSKRGKSSTPIIDAMVELCSEFNPLPPGSRITRPERVARNTNAGEASDSNSTPVAPPVAVGAPFEPSTVLHMLRDMNNGDSFRIEGRQEDAEEFLGCLLNKLNDEMLELIKLYEPEDTKETPVTVNGNDAAQESDDDEEWKVMGPKNKGSIERRCLAGRTPLSDIFRGQLRSRLQRATDSTTSDTHSLQPFFTLPLDIEHSNSVREALERVAYKDRLEGVTCPSRGRLVEAWQQVLLDRLPVVLLLHLKCFHCRPEDGTTVKIMKTIEFPIDLKIDPKIISSKMKYTIKQRSYKLFAVVYHEGSEAEKGHYLTDAYHVGCGGWLRYDDSVVTSITEQQVLHPRPPRTPYLLLYRRQDTMQASRHPQN